MNAPAVLESVCPEYDAREWHKVIVSAPATAVYTALYTTELDHSPLVRALLALRALPSAFSRAQHRPQPRRPAAGVQSVLDAGFGLVAEVPGQELVLGIGGAFWQPRPRTFPLDAHLARARPAAGNAHAVWNFHVVALQGERTLLTTETRVLTGDRRSRHRFRAYWVLVRPFSGLIRRAILRSIRIEAERAYRDAHRR